MAVVVDSFSLLLHQFVQDGENCMSRWTKILAFVGAYYTLRLSLKKTYQLLQFVIQLRKKLSSKNFVKEYGRWAIITGGTSGIGEAFADQFACRGMNIMLIGRSNERMMRTANHLENLYGVKCVVMVMDFTSVDMETMLQLEKLATDMDVGVLLNSAGVHYTYPMLYHEVDQSTVASLSDINMKSLSMVTRAVLPGMIERKRGLIVNMASAAGMMPTPYISLYSASKAFVEHLSLSLRHEVEPYNVKVQCLTPMYIQTKMTAYSSALNMSNCLTPLPETYARHAMKTLGHYYSNTGYFPHYLQTLAMKYSPRFVSLNIGIWMHRYLNVEGKESLKKDL